MKEENFVVKETNLGLTTFFDEALFFLVERCHGSKYQDMMEPTNIPPVGKPAHSPEQK